VIDDIPRPPSCKCVLEVKRYRDMGDVRKADRNDNDETVVDDDSKACLASLISYSTALMICA